MVTILLPTANRPDMLATALRSISEQTAKSEIAKVVVSENAGDSRSREVCRQFSDLPITYIFREPQLPHHFTALKEAVWPGEFTVMLHDDDWWAPDFLRTGIEALNSHPQASTFCCNCYYVTNEDEPRLDCPSNLYFWFGADYPGIKPVWEMSLPDVFLACLLNTPAHYSAIMARAEPFRKSAVIYDTGNTFDTDRMSIFELSRYGTILYSTIPHVFYRVHAEQLTHTHSTSGRAMQMIRTTEWMLSRSGESWQSLGSRFYERVRNCPNRAGDLRIRIYDMSLQPWCLPLLVSHLGDTSDVARLEREIRKRARLKKWLKPYCPPVLLEKGKLLSRFLGKNRP